MNEIKQMIITYLSDEYDELEATKQVCFANIEETTVVKITYDNGVVELLEKKGNKLFKHNK